MKVSLTFFFAQYPENMFIVFIKPVILTQTNDNGDDQKTYRHTDCQPQDIYYRKKSAPDNIPEGN
jgi:hypothetical protein